MTAKSTRDWEGDEEHHPAWGLIRAHRGQNGPPGSTLFDSDIRHQHSVVVTLHTATRRRALNRDHAYEDQRVMQVEFSEAQWASFVSSMNSSGVPCTIRFREGAEEPIVPEMPFEPRLKESMEEVRTAADEAVAEVAAALAEVEEAFEASAGKKVLREKIRTLHFAIANMPANMSFAAKSLSEHAENVVQRSKADIEAMVISKANQLGLEPSDIGGTALLGEGDD